MMTMKESNRLKPVCVLVILIGLGIMLPPTGRADIYSWTDADGVRHFANKPPSDAVAAIRQREEIPYDSDQDRQIQEADERYFDRRAMENVLRRLAQTERALAESGNRTQSVASRPENSLQVYDDAPYYGGTSYGGGYYDPGERRGRKKHHGRRDRRKDRAEKRDRHRPENGPEMGAPLPEWKIRHDRIRRERRSKREREGATGPTRLVRAVPSPYYMGYRPAYTRDAYYGSGRAGNGRRGYHRRGGGGPRFGGARGRIAF